MAKVISIIVPVFSQSDTQRWLKRHRTDILALVAALSYSFLIWWPTRNLPYHWDSASFVINAARSLLEHNFQPFIAAFSDFAHPPLLVAYLAFIWKLFGQNFLVSHIGMFPFMPLLLFSTYLIGKKLADSFFGFILMVFVGLTPFVIAEYGLIYIDLPMGAFASAAIAARLYQKPLISTLFLSLAAGIKIPSLVLVPVFILFSILNNKTRSWKYLLLPLLPVILLIVWFLYHQSVTGWMFTVPGRQTFFVSNLQQFLQSAQFVLSAFIIQQFRYMVVLLALISLFYLYSRKKLNTITPDLWLLGPLVILGLLFYIVMGEFLARYSIFLLPGFYGICLYLYRKMVTNTKVFVFSTVILAVCFVSAWHPKIVQTKSYEFIPPSDLSYMDIISLGVQTVRYLQLNYPQAAIYGAFPESYQTTQPYQGYSTQPLNFTHCSHFKLEKNSVQIVYFHPYSPEQQYCNQVLQTFPNRLLKTFEKNGKWVDLYLIDTENTIN